MTTRVTVTGTGTPVNTPGRAGPGVLIRHEDVALQFDAGQGTRLRICESGFDIAELTAVFVTHHHSDHMVGLTDLLITRWLEVAMSNAEPLPVYVPDGMALQIVTDLLHPWRHEIAMRAGHAPYKIKSPDPSIVAFEAADSTKQVAVFGDVTVSSSRVQHSPVDPAVGYRIETPDGVAAVSGDTRVCDELEQLCSGADVAVCEVIRPFGLVGLLSDPQKIAAYHADVTELGAMADRAGIEHLVLTHLIPPPQTQEAKDAFERDLRAAGYTGLVTVADDLDVVQIGGP